LADGGEYVFPRSRSGKPLPHTVFLELVKRTEAGAATPHGFRSTFRDWTAEQTSFPREVCEQALAHRVESKVEAAYRRSDLFERRRELMGAWATFATARPVATIVPLRRA
jgi:integrase